jgi:hypothetical protein
MIKDEKKVPKREAASKVWADNYDPYDPYWHGSAPLYNENWRDFITMKVQQRATKNTEYLQYSPSKMIDTVMRRGSISLGRKTKIIKCPGTSKPGVCVICPIQFKGEEQIVCSGPTVEKTKGGLIRSEKTYYEDEGSCCQTYDSDRLFGGREDGLDFIAYVHQELQDHPEYDVYDYVEQVDDPEARKRLEKKVEKYE